MPGDLLNLHSNLSSKLKLASLKSPGVLPLTSKGHTFYPVLQLLSVLKEFFFSSSAETGLFDVQISTMAAKSFLYEVSVLLSLIPSPEVINLCLGHQNPSLQQLVLISRMLQVKKKHQQSNIIPVGRHFPLDIKKSEMDLFSLSFLFIRRKSMQENITFIPKAVTRDSCHHPPSCPSEKSWTGRRTAENGGMKGCRTSLRSDRVDPFSCGFYNHLQ